MQFPLQPFLDRVIVEVIPIEDYYEKSSTIEIELDRTFSQRSDRGIVKSVGMEAEHLIEPGDTVQFDPDTAYAGLLYLNPADKNKPEKPKYLEIRVGDLLGRVMVEKAASTVAGAVQRVKCSKCGSNVPPSAIEDWDGIVCGTCVAVSA